MNSHRPLARAGAPLAALFLAACGAGLDADQSSDDAMARPAATVIPPPPIGLPPPPIPVQSPQITAPPTDAIVGSGAAVRFSVGAKGFAPFTYRWHRNGVVIAGATAANYDIVGATAQNHAGTYMVRVTDQFGYSATASATLQIVSGAWAPLSGRSIRTTAGHQQPSMAFCGQLHVAHIAPFNGRNLLYVQSFDGIVWKQKGSLVNATADGSAFEPSLACVSDGNTQWPAVAWSEGNSVSRNIHVRYWNGSAWQPAGDVLNIAPGSMAVKPVLVVPPFDENVHHVPIGGITRRAAVAWVENGRPSMRRWDNGWKLLYGGSQVPYASTNASDVALSIDLNYQDQYPYIVAWMQAEGGGLRPYAARHSATDTGSGEQGGWSLLATPAPTSFGNPLAASAAGRISIATGKAGSPSRAIPVALWADSGTLSRVRSFFYPAPSYQFPPATPVPWLSYGAFSPAGTLKALSLDPSELPRLTCTGGAVPSFGLAVSDPTGFEVRTGTCGQTTLANWTAVLPRHSVSLEEVSLRMAGATDPYVAGTRLVSGSQHELSVWKFYP